MSYAEAVTPLERRVSKILDKLIKDEEAFRGIDKAVLMKSLSEITDNFSDSKFDSISDKELTSRLEGILSLEALSGLLKDLTPEQIEAFDEAVKRREFF